LADNSTLPATGEIIASDEIAGVKYQRTKVVWGVDGVATDTSATNPMPVSLMNYAGLTDAQLRLTPVPVSGSFFQATQPVSGTFFQVTQPVSGSFFQATQPVSGSFFQTTQPVSGAFFQATQPVSGTFFQATQPVSGSVTQVANGVISTANVSTAALAANAVYTGTGEDVTEFADVRVAVFADQASAVDGLQIQQSSNGTNWDVSDAYTIPAAAGRVFSVAVSARFMRIVYTNGATAQAAFRLQIKLHKSYSKSSSVRPQDARSNDNDFEEMLAHNMVYNGASWDRARGDATNGARMQLPAVTSATILSVANTTATLNLPAPAAGLFHYITRIRITLHNTSATAVAGSAVTLGFTSTNIPGALAWTDGNALGAGTSKTVTDEQLSSPIKATAAATATTIVAPAAGAGVVCRLTAYFYTGP